MRRLAFMMLLLSACAAAGVRTDEAAEPATTAPVHERDEIRIPLSLYIVKDDADATGALSSTRSIGDVTEIAGAVNRIWAEADIVFDPVTVREIDLPADVLRPIADSLDTTQFFAQVGLTFAVPEPGAINGFFVRTAGQVNGFAPTGSQVFFVVDEPTVHDERVSSHEIGHILGLHHALDDAGRLMFSGTNGMDVVDQEQVVARYAATGLLR